MSDPPLPDSLTGDLSRGVAGSSLGQSGVFAFCSEAPLAPFPFPRGRGVQVPPADAEADRHVAGSGLRLPQRRCCPPPVGRADLWRLDLVLNSELLEKYEQCISLTLAHTRPLL